MTATVNKGFNFEGWYINGNRVSSDFEYSFTMKDENVNVEAVYSYYSITVESWSDEQGTAGTYPKKDHERISAGETVTLTATVADGYTFDGWYLGDICVSTDYEYSYTMTKESVDLVAKYTYYTLTVYATETDTGDMDFSGDRGNVSCYDEEKIQVGETITLTATAKSGYRFIGWSHGHGGITISTDSTYTFVMPATDECYVAVFEKI